MKLILPLLALGRLLPLALLLLLSASFSDALKVGVGYAADSELLLRTSIPLGPY
jgi:hypothetical protein